LSRPLRLPGALLPAKFAMVITPASTALAPRGEEESGAAEMAARIASGPGFWTDWLAELDRQGLLEELLDEDVIVRALREAPPGHKYDRLLTAKMTVICVLVACLFPGAGYDTVLATAFGLPGLRLRPGAEIPSGSAFSQARKLLGDQVMQRLFELDAAVPDAALGIGLLWKGLEVTAIDGTTMELTRNDVLEDEFGTPADGARPLLRVTAHVRTATFRWIGSRRPLRGQSPDLARQEAWALLLIHNITATAAARAAGSAGLDPGLIPFTAVLGLVRSHVAADTRCRHCGHRPATADAPLASLNAAILAIPRHRPGRQRTSGRTAAERRTRHTEEVSYTIDITKSNLPKWTLLRKLKGSGLDPLELLYRSGLATKNLLAMPIEVLSLGTLSVVGKQQSVEKRWPTVVLPVEVITADCISQWPGNMDPQVHAHGQHSHIECHIVAGTGSYPIPRNHALSG